MRLAPERVWWHAMCNAEVAADVPPDGCRKCGDDSAVWSDLGWRVGFNGPTYSYYASRQSADRDPRLRRK